MKMCADAYFGKLIFLTLLHSKRPKNFGRSECNRVKVNGYIQGKQLCQFHSCFCFQWGKHSKGRICSHRTEFLPLTADLFFEGISSPNELNSKLQKLSFSEKIMLKHGIQ